MNVFIIPSWYPSEVNPISGIFIREQVQAIADLAPDLRIIVSTWGHDDGLLSLRRPNCWPRLLDWRIKQVRSELSESNGLHQIHSPRITWSDRLPFGGVGQLIRVNHHNFRLAQDRWGPIDLIHAHVSYPGGYIASVLARCLDVPYVLTEHMGPFPFPSLMRHGRPIEEITQAFSEAAASVAVSPALAERITSFGYPKPTVIPNMVNEQRFYPGQPRDDKIVFFTLCAISEQKGIGHLLEAIALWNPPAEKYEFLIGGEGPQRAQYEAKSLSLGIADRVRWLGPVSRAKVPELFRQSHVFVMPSMHESFGVVYTEALACGKPVIATRCGGPEAIVHEENGLLVEVSDVHALAQAMRAVAANWSCYDSGAIRRDFEARFSRPAVVGQLRNLYLDVCGGAH
jgi:glycosyltransferase involved in cell wall biosynthesis